MYWEDESKEPASNTLSDDVVDLVFGISCRALPVDHAYDLSQAIQQQLNWFASEPGAAMHTIHVAESGNGWFRPDSSDQVLYPSRRTKLILRLPQHRIEDAMQLVGRTLNVGGYELLVNNAAQRQLSAITTLFARYIALEDTDNEVDFMQVAHAKLGEMGVRPKKMMCGTLKRMNRPEGPLLTRSVMLANLKFEETVKLQQLGIGSHRWMGCGVFIPHKDINEIGETMS